MANIAPQILPKTNACAIKLVSQVTNPPNIFELKDVDEDVELSKWQDKVKQFQMEFKEEFPDTVQIGISISTLPMQIQDFAYTTVDMSQKYVDVAVKIRAIVAYKVSMMQGEAPLECNAVTSTAWRAANAWGDGAE
jgi:hypothetical protein